MKETSFSVSANGLSAICFQRPDIRPPQGIKIDHEDWEKENWIKKVYRNSDGKIIIPTKLIRKALIVACRFTEQKPGGKLRSFKPFVETCLIIENDAILEYDEKKSPHAWLDYPTRGNGKMPVYRPVIEMPWSFGIRVSCFDSNLKKAVIEDLFEVAGRVCGLGEARNYMGYGKFSSTVTQL